MGSGAAEGFVALALSHQTLGSIGRDYRNQSLWILPKTPRIVEGIEYNDGSLNGKELLKKLQDIQDKLG